MGPRTGKPARLNRAAGITDGPFVLVSSLAVNTDTEKHRRTLSDSALIRHSACCEDAAKCPQSESLSEREQPPEDLSREASAVG